MIHNLVALCSETFVSIMLIFKNMLELIFMTWCILNFYKSIVSTCWDYVFYVISLLKLIVLGFKKCLYIDLRERSVAPLIHAFIGWFLYVPWLGIEPATLAHQDDALTTWATQPGLIVCVVFFFRITHYWFLVNLFYQLPEEIY